MALSKDETKSIVMANVKAILAKQVEMKMAPKWGTAEHNLALAKTAEDCGLDKDARADFMECLMYMGLGGNASQFRQGLVKEKLLPENSTKAVVDMYTGL